MTRKSLLALALAATTALTLSTPAFSEGKTDQARKAIAAAQAKIDAMNIVGAAGDVPRLHAEAVSTLHKAQDELSHHDKEAAIHDATHASELADMALVASQKQRNDTQQATTADAQRQATDAQRQASDANARAAAAQSDAAAAQAAAAAARATPPVIVQTPAPAPAPTSTTVTTSTDQDATTAPPTKVKRRVVRHGPTHRRGTTHRTRTTTTVKTGTR